MPEENKKRFPLWMYPSTQQRVQELYEKDNCKSQSEFIEKAIRFYIGYLSAEGSMKVENLVEYVATRDGVEKISPASKDTPPTQKLKELIQNILIQHQDIPLF